MNLARKNAGKRTTVLSISCLIAVQLGRVVEGAPPDAEADALIRRLPRLCETADGATRRYRSRNFLLHTDLPDAEARLTSS